MESEVETTGLQKKLEKIATHIGLMGMYAALLTVQTLFFRFFISRFIQRQMDAFGGAEDVGFYHTMGGALKDYC